MTKSDRRIFIDAEQAISLLAEGDQVHTFRNPTGGVLVGADWDREDVLSLLSIYQCEIGGYACRESNHGLAVRDKASYLFIATKPGIDWAAEEQEAIHRRGLAERERRAGR